MSNPFFSVVIPVFNRSATVGPSLNSVRNQTFPDFECIVVDDGSDDGAQLEAVVASLGDQRFRYVRRENGGGGAARNTGIELAAGQYVALLDSDDLYLSEKLEVMRLRIAEDPCAVWYSPAFVDRGVGAGWIRPGRPIGAHEDVGEYLFVHNNFIPTPTMVIPVDVARAVGFDANLRKGQDLDFCVRLQAAGVRFRMAEVPLVVWNDAAESGRASRTSGYQAPKAWLDRIAPILTKRAVHGYKANYLAYYVAWSEPWVAFRFLLEGLIRGGVPPRVIARQVLRCFMPRAMYRSLVNAFVRTMGLRSLQS